MSFISNQTFWHEKCRFVNKLRRNHYSLWTIAFVGYYWKRASLQYIRIQKNFRHFLWWGDFPKHRLICYYLTAVLESTKLIKYWLWFWLNLTRMLLFKYFCQWKYYTLICELFMFWGEILVTYIQRCKYSCVLSLKFKVSTDMSMIYIKHKNMTFDPM